MTKHPLVGRKVVVNIDNGRPGGRDMIGTVRWVDWVRKYSDDVDQRFLGWKLVCMVIYDEPAGTEGGGHLASRVRLYRGADVV
jgi:hypothetical protein